MIHCRCETEEKYTFTNSLNVLDVEYSLHRTPEEGVWCIHFNPEDLHVPISRLKAREALEEAIEYLKDQEIN